MKTHITINVFMVAGTLAFAQYKEISFEERHDRQSFAAPREWVRRYNGPANLQDFPSAIAVDDSGNIHVTGYSDTINSYDIATIKYNSAGATQWVARYSHGFGKALVADHEGNVYVTGHSSGDCITLKYDRHGKRLWAARYNGPANDDDNANAIAVDDSGNVYMTGYSSNTHSSYAGYDYITIKYDSAGKTQWTARYNGPSNNLDIAVALAVDALGNVYVTGHSSTVWYYSDYVTVKYSSAGVQQWAARYDGLAHRNDHPKALALDANGNIYVTGWSVNANNNGDYATVKYNPTGIQQWVARYDGPLHNGEQANALTIDGSGHVYVTGYSFGLQGYEDYATIKYNSAGTQQWIARYNGPANYKDHANGIVVDGFGNLYVTGHSFGLHGYADFVTVKYNNAGIRQWVDRYKGPKGHVDEAVALAVDKTGNLYVAGFSSDWVGNTNYVTIKYPASAASSASSSRSLTESEDERQVDSTLPAQFDLAQNYPNPFSQIPRFAGNPGTTIRFDMPVAGKVNLTIYNLRGELVRTLVDEEMAAGYHHVAFEANHLAAGIYFYRMAAGTYAMTRKMILQK